MEQKSEQGNRCTHITPPPSKSPNIVVRVPHQLSHTSLATTMPATARSINVACNLQLMSSSTWFFHAYKMLFLRHNTLIMLFRIQSYNPKFSSKPNNQPPLVQNMALVHARSERQSRFCYEPGQMGALVPVRAAQLSVPVRTGPLVPVGETNRD